MNLMLTILDLDTAVEELNALLSAPPEQCDIQWICSVCMLTRRIHVKVWADCPDAELAQDIVGLLRRAEDAMESASADLCPLEKAKAERHEANVKARIKNLESNYLQRKPSEFPPENPQPQNCVAPIE